MFAGTRCTVIDVMARLPVSAVSGGAWVAAEVCCRRWTVVARDRSHMAVASEARRRGAAVCVSARGAAAGVALIARAGVLPWTLVVAQRVDIAVVRLLGVAVEDFSAADAVGEDVAVVALAVVQICTKIRACPCICARAADAVVDV